MAEYRKGFKVDPETGLTAREARAGLTREQAAARMAIGPRLLVLIGVAVFSTTIVGAVGAHRNASSLIAFTSDRGADGSRELQLVSVPDRRRTRVTPHSPQGAMPSWSPDGRSVAFTSVESDGSSDPSDQWNSDGLWTVGSNGRRAHAVLEQSFPSDGIDESVWSPGGGRLAALVGAELWVIRKDGTHARRLNSGRTLGVEGVAWSPDGRRLAVAECRGGRLGCGISVVPASGGRWQRITRRPTAWELENETDETWEPSWSPDGKRIAFMRGLFDVGTTVPILVVSADGKGEHTVAHGEEPTWSPDGKWLAYVAAYGFTGSHGIRIVRSDGTHGRSLGNPLGYEIAPAWTLDGKTVVFATTMTPGLVPITKRSHLRFFASDTRSRRPRPLGRGLRRGFDRVAGDARWSRDGRRFVVWRWKGHFLWVEVVFVSGGRRVLLAPARDKSPAWSPDGRLLAFTREDRLGRSFVYVIGADGKRLRRLVGQATDPVWSPTGTTLSFERGNSVYLVRADGRDVRKFASGRDAAWAPSGGAIAFEQAGAIWSKPIGGGPATRISGPFPDDSECPTPYPHAPAWSPDGRRLAYYVDDSPTCYRQTLYISDADGGSRVAVDAGSESDLQERPSWSPDGQWLVFGDGYDIFVVNRDGGGRRKLGRGQTASWSPDGTKIGFSRTSRTVGRSQADIYVVNPDGSELRQLTHGGLNQEPAWRPGP